MSVNCIKCDGGTRVVSSRLPHRRRVCKGCGYRFNTTEVSDEAYVGYDELLTTSEAPPERDTVREAMELLYKARIDEQGSDDEQ